MASSLPTYPEYKDSGVGWLHETEGLLDQILNLGTE
jgi:hypothetical protein